MAPWGEFFVTLLEGADRETDTQEELLIDAKIGGAADFELAEPTAATRRKRSGMATRTRVEAVSGPAV